jgi:hypothetical protein
MDKSYRGVPRSGNWKKAGREKEKTNRVPPKSESRSGRELPEESWLGEMPARIPTGNVP